MSKNTEEILREFDEKFTVDGKGVKFNETCHTSPGHVRIFLRTVTLRATNKLKEIYQALTDEGFGNIDEVRLYYSKMIDEEYVKKEDVREVDEGKIESIVDPFLFHSEIGVINSTSIRIAAALAESFKKGELWKS